MYNRAFLRYLLSIPTPLTCSKAFSCAIIFLLHVINLIFSTSFPLWIQIFYTFWWQIKRMRVRREKTKKEEMQCYFHFTGLYLFIFNFSHLFSCLHLLFRSQPVWSSFCFWTDLTSFCFSASTEIIPAKSTTISVLAKNMVLQSLHSICQSWKMFLKQSLALPTN